MIHTLVFDFGAVLLPLQENLSWKAFEALGAKDSLRKQTETFHLFETGTIDEKTFIERLQPHFFRKIFRGDLISAWNAMLISPIQDEIIALLKQLKKEYKLLLLSNTNALHISNIKAQSGAFTYKQFTRQFEQVYYSHEVGQRKPDAAIFETLLKDHKLEAENGFYVDDKLENIEAGKALGFKTWHFDPESDTIHDLDKVLSTHRE